MEIPSSTPIPDTQQTLVSDSTQEPSDKDAGKTIAPGLEPSLELIAGAPNADQQNTHMSNEATSVEPASLAILISEAVTSTRTADPSPDLQSSAPPLASLPPLPVPLPPLPPRYANEDVDQQRGTESGEGEDIPVPEEGLSTAANVEPVSAEQAAPKGKKRGRPPGSKNTKDASASKKAKTNKKEATSKKSSKRKKKMIAGGGAELGSDNEAEPDNVLDNPEGEDVDVEAAIAQAVARAGVPTQATPSREGTEGAEGTSEGQAGDETAALNGTTRKPTTKRKAPYKSKKKKKKARRASTIGEDEEGEEEDSDEEVDEDGNPIIIPWEIKKIRPGYSLSTDDIYAAIGVDPPASFEFMTGQDEVEVYEDEQEEEHVEEEEENGDETMRQEDEEDGEERQNEGEVIDGEDGLPGNTSASIPWLPFKGPIDPTITTMRQLTEDTGRGRMASKGSSSFTEKIDRKQRLKLARETMKLRTKLIRSGIKPEAVDRVLNEKSEELFSSNNGNNGTVIVEFDVGDQLNAPSGMASQGVNGHDAASRRGTPLASTSGNQQPLFRPEDDSGEDEDAQSGHQDSDEDENDNEQQDGQEEEEGFDDIVESRYAPQMKVVNGELVLDENSTQVVLVSIHT